MKAIQTNAKFIWAKDCVSRNQHAVFYRSFLIDKIPEKIEAIISVDTKYWLYINEKQVVFEGGLFRESLPGAGYADIVDITKFLHIGHNMIAIECWYYGNEGRNNVDSGTPYLYFEAEEIGINSDSGFKYQYHPAFYQTEGDEEPSYLYGGYNIGFDSNLDKKDIYNPADYHNLESSIVYPPNKEQILYERPIPLIKKFPYTSCKPLKKNNYYEVKFLHAAQALIHFVLVAKKNTVLNIKTDRYETYGGPGDEHSLYKNHRIEYICKEGINEFTSNFYLFGEKFIIETDQDIEIMEIGYFDTGYDCDIIGKFHCSCDITNRLVEKAARTLYVCMRDNFMDCPDRERGQWIGDVAVQAPQVFFLLSQSAQKLLKKCIYDFINLRKGDKLVGCVPGVHSSELPAQSLIAIGEYGIISTYYKYTNDLDVLKLSFEPSVKYLMLWEMQSGLLKHRNGDWSWFDHLYNVDQDVLENAWYYSSLKFVKKVADLLDDHRYDSFINERIEQIGSNFNKRFWKGSYYASKDVVDDRANAVAVLAGLCEKENYEKIKGILLKVFNATVFMENFVLEALCQMGYIEEAYRRMVSRYYNLAVNENSTLWEDFFILGTKNHAWSGAPATIAFKYFLGIDTDDGFKTYTFKPVEGLFDNMSCEFYMGDNKVTINYPD